MAFEKRMRAFRSHGIQCDHLERQAKGSWYYEIVELGYNYRITDIQCALGISQLRKLQGFLKRRREIASIYDKAFEELSNITPLAVRDEVRHAYHLYVVRIDFQSIGCDRARFFEESVAKGIGVNVHYIPVHLHPFYRRCFGTSPGLCPVAEKVYEQIVTLPIHPGMSNGDVDAVIGVVTGAVK